MGLDKLLITSYSDDKFGRPTGDSFSVQINPQEYTHSYSILYTDPSKPGSSGSTSTFEKMGKETVSFVVYFDGTGVVPGPHGAPPPESTAINTQIKDLKNVIFKYNRQVHRPNYLELAWGTMVFRCRLTKLELTYTVFQPDGTPVRARATMSFLGFTSAKGLALEAQDASPDMTHIVTVAPGDTLPLLCYRIYGTSLLYIQVARFNGLTAFRNLQPGSRLLFPPLAEATS